MERKQSKFRKILRQLTPTVSVALVLLMLGITGVLAIAGRAVSDNIKENLGFNLVLRDDATEADANALKQLFTGAPYVASYEYLSAEEILHQEEALIGEDIVEVVGVNPYQPEFNVRVKAAYANVDSISRITEPFHTNDLIDTVQVHTDMVNEINSNIRSLSIGLLVVAIALLVISFVLINNTVRLTIYSRRFLLHTMRLVGATDGFIRRPIVRLNALCGLVAGILGSLMLIGLMSVASNTNPELSRVLAVNSLWPVFAGMMVLGIVICALAAWFATNKYLRQDYDDLF